MASNAENVSIWWRHHVDVFLYPWTKFNTDFANLSINEARNNMLNIGLINIQLKIYLDDAYIFILTITETFN